MIAIVGQISSIGAKNANNVCSVTKLERVDVFDDYCRFTRRKQSIGELELDSSADEKAIHIERSGTHVLHFDKFKIIIVVRIAHDPCRVIHDFGDPQWRYGGEERLYRRRAPG